MSEPVAAWRSPVRAGALLACGLIGAVAMAIVLRDVLPMRLGTRTFLPYEAGGFLLTLTTLWALRPHYTWARAALPWAALAIGLAVAGLVLSVLIGDDHFVSGRKTSQAVVACATLGAVTWLASVLAERRSRVSRHGTTAVLVALAIVGFTFSNGRPMKRALHGELIQPWNNYHYYLGSRYFAEVGYEHLYVAHLAADDQWIRERPPEMDGRLDYADATRVRDMTTYRLASRDKLLDGYDPLEHFSEARWEAFGRDLRSLRPYNRPKQWRKTLMDLGYNPSPVWTLVGTPMANLIPLESRWYWLIINSDLPLHLAALLAMGWAFGLRRTAMAVLFLSIFPVNGRYFSGGFLRYDWLNMALIGMALYHKGWGRSAGMALGWAAMTRVFPGFLALPVLVRAVIRIVREGRGAFGTRQVRFAGAFCAACALLFGASHFTGRGISTWVEWKDAITLHSANHPFTSSKRVGVPRLALHQPKEGRPWRNAIKRSWDELPDNERRMRIIQVVGMALLLPALLRRRDLDAMVLMLAAVFLLLTLSRYYASIWVMLLWLGVRGRNGPLGWGAALAGTALMLMIAVFGRPPTDRGQYFLLNYEALALFVVLCVGYLARDLRDVLRPEEPPDSSV